MLIENRVLDFLEGHSSLPLLDKLMRGISHIYAAAISFRNWAYDKKLVFTSQVSIPVISIGNIVCGGTGKTPFVHFLAERLLKEKEKSKIAILSRGAGGELEKGRSIMDISSGEGLFLPPHMCGDEPRWLAWRLPKISIWVGKNRSLSAKRAVEQGTEVILLDDGMQYRKLKRDIEIAILDAEDPLGRGFLPYGLRRENPYRLQKANFVVLNRVQSIEEIDPLKEKLAPYTSGPFIVTRMKPVNLESYLGKKAGVFCAIGKPRQFLSMLRKKGIEVVNHLFGLDHKSFEENTLKVFAEKSKALGAELLLCTEKDKVKLFSDFETSLPIIAVEARMEIVEGSEHWEQLIKDITARMHTASSLYS